MGGYEFNNTRFGYAFGPQRLFSGNASVEYGTFFGGIKTLKELFLALHIEIFFQWALIFQKFMLR